MPRKWDWRDRLTSLLDLPDDVLRDLSRITLVGAGHLSIENHRGLVAYQSDRLVVRTPMGNLAVYGTDLTVGRITPEAVVVVGIITGLQLLEREA